jgi:hypothetical protein
MRTLPNDERMWNGGGRMYLTVTNDSLGLSANATDYEHAVVLEVPANGDSACVL